MKYLIVGLGNIGQEYKNTRHNIGFTILDQLTKDNNVSFEQRQYASVAKMRYKGRQLVLIKPTTYMNLSGKAVNYWMQKEKIPLSHVLIIVDDVALPFGTLRLRAKGSSGGHNGLAHIEQTINTSNYPRLRFGIGNEFPRGQQINYVLGKWSADELSFLPERVGKAIDIILSVISIGFTRTLNSGIK
ncbi:MAG: aminoacyl-tRNA hydrolase [Bacteroidales bacterium]|jgi:PTH1 family peptidyl-tRNA hydrolase|nr:aminoacyl-tRNA hydrolase [Bacteroidales bacterium]